MTKKSNYLLPDVFRETIVRGGETGMGWTAVCVYTKKGEVYKNVIVYSCKEIIAVLGFEDLPFDVDDIQSIIVTHRKDFPSDFSGFQIFNA